MTYITKLNDTSMKRYVFDQKYQFDTISHYEMDLLVYVACRKKKTLKRNKVDCPFKS